MERGPDAEGSLPIGYYAMLADCNSAALVSRQGSIDWLCLPRFDSHACFAALLGTPEHGRWLLGPADEDAVFFHDVPAGVTAAATGRPFAQSGTPFADPWPLTAWPGVPTRVLAGRDDRLFPVEFQRRVAAERLGLPVDEVPGGHLVALARPAELADRLVGYLPALSPTTR